MAAVGTIIIIKILAQGLASRMCPISGIVLVIHQRTRKATEVLSTLRRWWQTLDHRDTSLRFLSP